MNKKEFYQKSFDRMIKMIAYYNEQHVIDALGIGVVIERLYKYSQRAVYYKNKLENVQKH